MIGGGSDAPRLMGENRFLIPERPRAAGDCMAGTATINSLVTSVPCAVRVQFNLHALDAVASMH